MPFFNKRWFFIYVLLGLLVYGSAVLGNEFVNWDDQFLIVKNVNVHGLSLRNLWNAFTTYDPELYVPLTMVSFQLNYLLTGLNPIGFHAINLLLHIINAILVTVFIQLLLEHKKKGGSISHFSFLIPHFVGLLFLIHPINTEVVVWASARKDSLSVLFFLASVIAYLRFRESGSNKTKYWSLAWFGCALLSKVTAATLPIILVLIDEFHGRRLDRKSLQEKLPYFGLSFLFGIIALLGKTSVLDNTTILEKVMLASKNAMFILERTIFPHTFSALHPLYGDISLGSSIMLLPLIGLLILLTAIWFLRKHKQLVFGFWFFLICLSPTFFHTARPERAFISYDRYAYLPSIGIIFIVSICIAGIMERLKKKMENGKWKIGNPISNFQFLILAIIILLPLSTLAYNQAATWDTTETLFKNVLKHYPHSSIALDHLGNLYTKRGEDTGDQKYWQEAQEFYETGLQYHPQSAHIRNNLGALYGKMGREEIELKQYEFGVKSDPHFGPVRYNLALAHKRSGDMELYIRELTVVHLLNPDAFDVEDRLVEHAKSTNNPECLKAIYEHRIRHDVHDEVGVEGLQQVAQQLLERDGELDPNEWSVDETIDIASASSDNLYKMSGAEICTE